MVNLMEKKNYDLTQITRLLLEMRENCALRKEGEAYDDPKRMEKYDALNAAIDLINNPSLLVTGDTSDGYHTFNELYHHRAVLFSVIVRDHPEWCWKAKKHEDGTMYDGMFIVGINTPHGQASYHYDIDPYWDMFHCEEYEFAPEWDGHTPDDAINRIAALDAPVVHARWIDEIEPNAVTSSGREVHYFCCSACGFQWNNKTAVFHYFKFCPNCGARMDGEAE